MPPPDASAPRAAIGAVLGAVARPVFFAQYLVQRQIMRASAFPVDDVRGVIPGADPLRLVVIGEATAVGYGTLVGELSIAGHLARQVASARGGGVVWSAVPFPDYTVHTASAVVSDAAALADADVVAVMLGIGDALRVTPVRTWTRLLGAALDGLRATLPPHAIVVIAEVPPLDAYPFLPWSLRPLAGRQARLYNEATRALASAREGFVTVPFPPERLPDLRHPDAAQVSAVYAAWARALAAALD